jgi:hypothetical protein
MGRIGSSTADPHPLGPQFVPQLMVKIRPPLTERRSVTSANGRLGQGRNPGDPVHGRGDRRGRPNIPPLVRWRRGTVERPVEDNHPVARWVLILLPGDRGFRGGKAPEQGDGEQDAKHGHGNKLLREEIVASCRREKGGHKCPAAAVERLAAGLGS